MSRRVLTPGPLRADRFAPYGNIIATSDCATEPMNEARFTRYGGLATVDVDPAGDIAIGIVQSRTPTSLPYAFDMVERHPRGSQAFVPLAGFPFVIVVGPPGESVEAEDLEAFISNGRQGIQYHRGTWHMPLIALEEGQQFLVIDRERQDDNCEERVFDEPLVLAAPAY